MHSAKDICLQFRTSDANFGVL